MNENAITKAPQAGITARAELGAQEITRTGETVASVLAARAKAEVEARFIMAERHPRDWLDVRRKLLDACERPGFAGSAEDKGSGWWRKPVGQGSIEGFSIRFAEEAMRAMGNMDARATILWEDEEKRLVEINVVDFESNISIPTTVTINKTIERKFLKKGEVAISMRTNSEGKVVYLRAATEDEVLQKQNSAISKAMRTAILRLLPGDIQDECKNRILRIRGGDAAKDPSAYQKKVVDGFAQHGIKSADLAEYLGHSLESCSQPELLGLRDLWKEINDGNLTWHQIITEHADEQGDEPPDKPKAPTSLDDVADEIQREEANDFDVFAELRARAEQMFGLKADEALKHRAEQLGFNPLKINEKQAGTLLDLLNEEANNGN
jgi:hypothetical protein